MRVLFNIIRFSWRLCLAALGLCFVGGELNDVFVYHLPYDWFADTMVLLIGLAMMYPFFRFVIIRFQKWRESQTDESYVSLFASKTVACTNYLLGTDRGVHKDYNEQEALITQFKEDYNQFFELLGNGVRENTPLQNSATQVYWNTLSLQKKRLDKKGITMSIEAQRMRYNKGESPVSVDMIFDGKYEISYISEMIHAVRRFFRNGKKIGVFKSKEIARYRLLNAKRNHDGMITCPNCGSLSSRENLIDGCDFCGAKFTVEDLGMRVSDFHFYPDPDVEYKKYQEKRSRYLFIVALLSGIPCFLLMIQDTIKTLVYNPLSQEGALFDLGVMIIITVIMMFIVIGFFEGLFLITLFPFLQAKASLTYITKKVLNAIKKSEKHNLEAEEKIRSYDKLFSLGGFYADIQNKLAVLHYAQNSKEMEAFGEGEGTSDIFASLPARYENVINMDVIYMVLNDYVIDGEYQKTDVTVNLSLLETKGRSVKKRTEKIHIRMIKNKNCLTQAISGPEMMHCKKCGASISLLEGSTCKYCGHVRHLSNYDWAIEDYEIL